MISTTSLGEICQFMGGGTPSRKIRQYWNGHIPWATVKDFRADRISQTDEFISQEGLDNSASKIVSSGTVLLVTRVGLGKVAIADVDLAINQDIKAVVPAEGLLPEFLFWSLKYLGPEIEHKGTGATVKGITLRDVQNLEIPLPPLNEQRRIVNILNRAAKIERLRKQAQERLQEFIPALFIKMFGNPTDNPMGWTKCRIGQVCVQTETRNPGETPSAQFRYVDISGIDTVQKRIAATRLLLGKDAPSRARKEIRTDDILVSSVRPNLNAVAIVPDELNREIASTGFCVLRANRKLIEPLYLFSHVTSPFFVETISSQVRGANYPAVSDKDIKNIWITVPPLKQQQQFTNIVESAHTNSKLAMRGSHAADNLTTSLMFHLLEADT